MDGKVFACLFVLLQLTILMMFFQSVHVVAFRKTQHYIKCLLHSETSPNHAVVPVFFLEQNVSISLPRILDADEDDGLHLGS